MVGKTILHYKIVEELGRGGMGVVYRAEDTRLGREVAIKFLPDRVAGKEERERFKIEAKAAAALNHPNIATIHAIEESADENFIVMEYIKGKDLKNRIEAGPLLVDDTIHFAIQIAQGLRAAHDEKVVHRDIKSANIMLTQRGDVKIMDFGLAKLGGQSKLTKQGTTLGTIAYMSPEQTRGEEVDHRSDIFSLGVIIYEMLTGMVPFTGDYDQAVIYSVMNEDPEPVTAIRTGIPMELEHIVNKCLRKDPSDRYQNAEDLIVDLRSIQKSGESKSQTTQKILNKPRSNRAFLYFAVAVIGVLLAAGGVYWLRPKGAIDSIAVMPFRNSNSDPDMEYLSDGITETLIMKLSNLPQLRVMARTTVFSFKGKDYTPQQVGSQLNVRAIVVGGIVQRGETLRINAELVDVSDGSQIWGERYDRTEDDIFAIQDAISEQISTSLLLKLSNEDKSRLIRRHTEDAEAYRLYLKGLFYLAKRNVDAIRKALKYFEEAVERDPDYALAYSGISDCYLLLPVHRGLSGQEAFPKLKAAALRALQIDDRLAEVHTVLAAGYSLFDRDWETAEKSFVRAIELNPNYATAHHWYGDAHLRLRGRFDQAIAEVKRALELDPLSLIINADLGMNYCYARRYDLAIDQLNKTLEMDPNFFLAHFYLATTLVFKGEFSQGIERFKQAQQLDNHPAVLGGMGFAYGMLGKRKDALRTLAQLEEVSSQREVTPYDFAKIHAGLGDKDRALDYLQQCVQQQNWSVTLFKIDPFWDSLRDDTRFQALLRSVGFDQ